MKRYAWFCYGQTDVMAGVSAFVLRECDTLQQLARSTCILQAHLIRSVAADRYENSLGGGE